MNKLSTSDMYRDNLGIYHGPVTVSNVCGDIRLRVLGGGVWRGGELVQQQPHYPFTTSPPPPPLSTPLHCFRFSLQHSFFLSFTPPPPPSLPCKEFQRQLRRTNQARLTTLHTHKHTHTHTCQRSALENV